MEFYATVDADSVRPELMPTDASYLFPASSFYRRKTRAGIPVPRFPPGVRTAADCGGFVATLVWGDYKYTPAEYVEWLDKWTPNWAATMDYCCEPEILGKEGVVRERQDRTTAMAHYFWDNYKDKPWAWVPTIQGWEVEDYRHHAKELAPLIMEMQEHYGAGSDFRVGIGTLCRRASAQMIREVCKAVADELPGVPLHLWGIKLGALQSRVALHKAVVSVDSAAWNGLFGEGNEKFKASGLGHRAYTYKIAMPLYQRKIDAALAMTKQIELF